eukprot:g2810.t1
MHKRTKGSRPSTRRVARGGDGKGSAATGASDERKKRLMKTLKRVPALSSLGESQLQTAVGTLSQREYVHGAHIFEAGGDGADQELFIIEKGQVVIVQKEGPMEGASKRFKPSEFFGDDVLMKAEGTARQTGTATAVGRVVVRVMSRANFEAALAPAAASQRRAVQDTEALAHVPVLSHLSVFDRNHLVNCMLPVHYSPGQYICRQGELGETFYIMLGGVCKVTITQSRESGAAEIEVRRLKPGDFFGEMALMRDDSLRTANVVALTPLSCMVLHNTHFQQFRKQLDSTLLQLGAGRQAEASGGPRKRGLGSSSAAGLMLCETTRRNSLADTQTLAMHASAQKLHQQALDSATALLQRKSLRFSAAINKTAAEAEKSQAAIHARRRLKSHFSAVRSAMSGFRMAGAAKSTETAPASVAEEEGDSDEGGEASGAGNGQKARKQIRWSPETGRGSPSPTSDGPGEGRRYDDKVLHAGRKSPRKSMPQQAFGLVRAPPHLGRRNSKLGVGMSAGMRKKLQIELPAAPLHVGGTAKSPSRRTQMKRLSLQLTSGGITAPLALTTSKGALDSVEYDIDSLLQSLFHKLGRRMASNQALSSKFPRIAAGFHATLSGAARGAQLQGVDRGSVHAHSAANQRDRSGSGALGLASKMADAVGAADSGVNDLRMTMPHPARPPEDDAKRRTRQLVHNIMQATQLSLSRAPDERDADDVIFIQELLKGVDFMTKFCKGWSQMQTQDLVRQLRVRTFHAQQQVFDDNETADAAYVVLMGSAVVSVGHGAEEKIVKLGPGESFGDKALLGMTARTSRVLAVTRVTCVVVPVRAYQGVIGSIPIEQKFTFLQTLPTFKGWDPYKLYKIAVCLRELHVSRGQVLLRAGDRAAGLLFLHGGEVAYTHGRVLGSGRSRPALVAKLGAGAAPVACDAIGDGKDAVTEQVDAERLHVRRLRRRDEADAAVTTSTSSGAASAESDAAWRALRDHHCYTAGRVQLRRQLPVAAGALDSAPRQVLDRAGINENRNLPVIATLTAGLKHERFAPWGIRARAARRTQRRNFDQALRQPWLALKKDRGGAGGAAAARPQRAQTAPGRGGGARRAAQKERDGDGTLQEGGQSAPAHVQVDARGCSRMTLQRLPAGTARRVLSASVGLDRIMASSSPGDQGALQLQKQRRARESALARAGIASSAAGPGAVASAHPRFASSGGGSGGERSADGEAFRDVRLRINLQSNALLDMKEECRELHRAMERLPPELLAATPRGGGTGRSMVVGVDGDDSVRGWGGTAKGVGGGDRNTPSTATAEAGRLGTTAGTACPASRPGTAAANRDMVGVVDLY